MAEASTDWSAVQNALVEWAGYCSGGKPVLWRDATQVLYGNEPVYRLHIGAMESRGLHTVSYDYDADNNLMIPRVNRIVELRLDVTCTIPHQIVGSLSQTLLHRFTMLSETPGANAILSANNIAYSRHEAVTSVEFEVDRRLLSIAATTYSFILHDVFQTTTESEDFFTAVTTDITGVTP